MCDGENPLINYSKNKLQSNNACSKYTQEDALKEFDELKNIALCCLDKNGNPNISAALRAIENKAKIAGLYSNNISTVSNSIKMNEITIDGQQLKLNIGEEFKIE